MRILLFSFIVWLSTLAIAAADNASFKFCRIPRTRNIRKKKYVKHEDFQKYVQCKEGKHRVNLEQLNQHVHQLNQQLINGDNCPDNDYPESTSDTSKCDETKIPKDPKALSEHIECDHKNNETNENCINRLQNLLQGFIDVHQELPIHRPVCPNPHILTVPMAKKWWKMILRGQGRAPT